MKRILNLDLTQISLCLDLSLMCLANIKNCKLHADSTKEAWVFMPVFSSCPLASCVWCLILPVSLLNISSLLSWMNDCVVLVLHRKFCLKMWSPCRVGGKLKCPFWKKGFVLGNHFTLVAGIFIRNEGCIVGCTPDSQVSSRLVEQKEESIFLLPWFPFMVNCNLGPEC